VCVDCVLDSPRIAQVDPGDEPLPEVVLSHNGRQFLVQAFLGGGSGFPNTRWDAPATMSRVAYDGVILPLMV
jgi:hypothetical protein